MFSIGKFTIYKRHLIAFLAFFGYMNMYCLRTNLSMALVEMTSLKPVLLENGTYTNKSEFEWNSHETGAILSAFSYGYVTTVLGGMIATRYGGATIFGGGILLTAAITLFTPLLFRLNLKLFLLSRIFEGIFEAASFSSMSELWSRWSPPEERSRLVSYSFTGVYVGLTVSYPISGFVASMWGWPAIFYTTGTAALLWSFIWLLVVRNEPANDRLMSEAERAFLAKKANTNRKTNITYPWRSVLKSGPVWTLCIVEFVFSCGYTIIILYLPLYIKDLRNTNINNIGILSALPHFFAVVSHPIAGYLADTLRNKKILTATQTHKIYICAGFTIGAILLNVAIFQPNFKVIISSLCLFRLFTSFSDVAFHVNVIDLSPHFASFLFGIATLFFTLGAMLSPIFISQVVQTHSAQEWNTCFFTFSIIYLFGAGLFFYFGSGDLQPWDHPPLAEVESKDEEDSV